MSWCDKLSSTPSVGFKLDHHFASSDAILHALTPILDNWVEGDKQKFSIVRQDSFSVTFSTNDGFQYGVEPSRVHISFTHKMKVKPISGGPPVMEMLSSPTPFTELLPKVSKHLLNATLLVPSTKNRTLKRVGIISTTEVNNEEVPPGIARFIKYIGRPWPGLLDQFDIRLTASIEENSNWSDRCIHTLLRPEDPEQLTRLQFDWQRTFTKGRAITADSLKEILARAEKDSISYFEELAEGNLFDEELISKAT